MDYWILWINGMMDYWIVGEELFHQSIIPTIHQSSNPTIRRSNTL
jgi:hypothetical protein